MRLACGAAEDLRGLLTFRAGEGDMGVAGVEQIAAERADQRLPGPGIRLSSCSKPGRMALQGGDLRCEGENSVPVLREMVGIAAGLPHEVGIVIDRGQRYGEGHRILLARDAAQPQRCRPVSLAARSRLRCSDEFVHRLQQATRLQRADIAQALEGDIGQAASDRLAEVLRQ